MRKKIFLYTLVCLFILISCDKEDALITTPDTNLGYISFTNANASKKLLNIFINTNKVYAVPLDFDSTSKVADYAGVAEGGNALLTRDPSIVIPAIDYYSTNINVVKGQAYSFFQYGVLTAGAFKGILLNTDRNPYSPTSGNSNVRFLNLSNGAPPLDFVLIRREGTSPKDSVILYSGIPSLATVTNPDVAVLSAYKILAANKAANTVPGVAVSSYILKLKLANTNTVVSSSGATTIAPGRNYTFYARGNYPLSLVTMLLDN